MQRSSRGLLMALAFGLLSGCNLAKLPGDTVFHCEADGTCGQSGFVCGGDRVCRPPVVVEEDAGELDAGVEDAGLDDAGFAALQATLRNLTAGVAAVADQRPE